MSYITYRCNNRCSSYDVVKNIFNKTGNVERRSQLYRGKQCIRRVQGSHFVWSKSLTCENIDYNDSGQSFSRELVFLFYVQVTYIQLYYFQNKETCTLTFCLVADRVETTYRMPLRPHYF